MKRFLQKFALLLALAAIMRLLTLPAAISAAEAALVRLGKSSNSTEDSLSDEAAVLSCESADPDFASSALKSLSQYSPSQQYSLYKSSDFLSTVAENLEINNRSSYEINVESLLSRPLSYSLQIGAPQVLIIHTHGSEAYSQQGGAYEESDVSRTTDISKNVVQVGSVLCKKLAEQGLIVLHDTELYDYPSYSGSYSRSLSAVEEYLRKYPTIKIVIDLHRDSATDSSGSAYRTEYISPDGEVCSQLMLISATGSAGLSFSTWEENLNLALNLQAHLAAEYPGLARPLLISDQRYNQHIAPGYLLLEVGTDGNTLAEAETAVSLFAECMADILLEIIE